MELPFARAAASFCDPDMEEGALKRPVGCWGRGKSLLCPLQKAVQPFQK